MGEFVKDEYGSKCYVIGFTCYDGKVGSISRNYIKNVPMASNKSIEYLLHESGFDYAFFDTDNFLNGKIIDKEFIARFLGFSNKRAGWANMMDGFIFIDNMHPNKRTNTNIDE